MLTDEGKYLIIDALRGVPLELRYIAENSGLSLNDKQRLEKSFPDYDKTKLVCFLFICSIFKKLHKGGDSIREGLIDEIDLLVFKTAEYMFGVNSVKWVETVFKR